MVVARRAEQVGDVVIVQGVVGVTAGAAHPDQPQHAKNAQVVGGRARCPPGGKSELLDGALAVQQLDEQPQTTGRGQRLERLGELLGLGARQGPRGRTVLSRMRDCSILPTYEQILSYRPPLCGRVGGAPVRRNRGYSTPV